VCTNRVAAVDTALAALRAQHIDVRFEEWTEEGCDRLIDLAHVVLLPTNLTGFSLSKTHNRCSEALARGCLVLGSPQGPYRAVGGAVFDDPEALADRLRRPLVHELGALLADSYRRLQDSVDTAADVTRLRQALAPLASARKRRTSPPAPRVLLMGRVKSDVPKAGRSLGYLIAGYADFGPQLEYDFRLESIHPEHEVLAVQLSAGAQGLTERTLADDPAMDVDDHGDHADYRSAGWHFRIERDSRRLTVLKGLGISDIQALASIQAAARTSESEQLAQVIESLVDVFARVLWQLGFRDIAFAAESEGGWQAFASRADPGLLALSESLKAHWVRHEGREFCWGRPVEEATP
jgi:hypothetical protein